MANIKHLTYMGHDTTHKRFWHVQIKLNTNSLTTHTYKTHVQ